MCIGFCKVMADLYWELMAGDQERQGKVMPYLPDILEKRHFEMYYIFAFS